jgi:alanyl-tRNA synthetase
LIRDIEQMAGWRYGARATGTDGPERYDANDPRELPDVACRVIADHTRMLTFALTDGALPGNEGRGYVVRRILRRAARFGRQHLGLAEPFIHQLVPTVVQTMGDAFPELTRDSERIVATIRDEEVSFGRTLDRGIQLFQQAAGRAQAAGAGRIEADDAFKLYDTYGFPLDLTVQMAGELGLAVDEQGFETLMDQARQRARAAARGESAIAFEGELPATTDQLKYLGPQCRGRVLGWVEGNRLVDKGSLEAGTEVGLLLDQTCFYGEQGGQVGDQGAVSTDSGVFRVRDTQRLGTGVVHVGQVEQGQIAVGQAAELNVDASREQTRRNHTATHLLHLALREALGEQVTQRGSLVEPSRLRFDFDHSQAVSAEQAARVERIVNGYIWADQPVRWYEKSHEEALELEGLRAFFGDKYGDVVRVVEIGDGVSRELCGGTHVQRTGQIGLFKVVAEEAVAKGVRRITAVTGMAALEHVQGMEHSAREAALAASTSVGELPARVADLQSELRQVRRQLQKGQSADVAALRRELLTGGQRIGRCVVVVGELPGVPAQQLRESVDWLRAEAGSAAVMLGSRQSADHVLLVAGLTEDMVQGGLHAGELIKQVAPIVGGGGGGKAGLAQAGGKRVDGLAEALGKARQILLDQVEKAG